MFYPFEKQGSLQRNLASGFFLFFDGGGQPGQIIFRKDGPCPWGRELTDLCIEAGEFFF